MEKKEAIIVNEYVIMLIEGQYLAKTLLKAFKNRETKGEESLTNLARASFPQLKSFQSPFWCDEYSFNRSSWLMQGWDRDG